MRGFVVSAAVGAIILVAQGSKTVEAQNGRWENAQSISEVAGACSVTSEAVDCWTLTGKHDEKLSELVKAYYLVNDQTLPIRLGMKNRYIVTKMTSKEMNRGGNNGQFSTLNGGYLNQCGSLYRNGGPTYTWYHVPTDQGTTKVSIQLQTTTAIDSVKDLELKVGSTTAVGDGELKITAISDYKMPPPQNGFVTNGFGMNAQPQYKWKIDIAKKGLADDLTIYFSGFDLKHLPISLIDDKGNLIAIDPNTQSYMPQRPGRFYPNFTINAKPDHYEVLSQVPPSKIGFLRVNANASTKVIFRDILLDAAP